MQVTLDSSSSEFEVIDIKENPIIEYNSWFQNCWNHIWPEKSDAADFSETTIKEYKSHKTVFLERTWKWIQDREAALTRCAFMTGKLAVCAAIPYLCLTAIAGIYAVSLAIGVTIGEILFQSTSIPTDSSWVSQYVYTPLIGLATPIGFALLCIGLLGAQLGRSQQQEGES